MYVTNSHEYWQLYGLPGEQLDLPGERLKKKAHSVPAELFPFALGLLYRKIDPPVSTVVDNCTTIDDLDKVLAGEDVIAKGVVRINPLVLRFSVRRNIESADGISRINPETVKTWLDGRPLLDVHIVADKADLPRLKLQELIFDRWRGYKRRPILTRLLFGEETKSKNERFPLPQAACFPLLDLMGGTFLIDGFAAEEATRWRWLPGPAFEGRADLLWLVECCTKRLGIDIVPKEDAAQVSDIHSLERDESAYHEHALETEDENDDADIWQDAPVLLRKVKEWPMGAQELETQLKSNRPSSSKFHRFRFIEEVGQRNLLPLSPILIQLPGAPNAILAKDDQKTWEKIRLAHRFDPRTGPMAAAAWWLEFLDGPPAVARPEAETWSLWGNPALRLRSWWWSWYVAMFRKPADWQPTWEAPPSAGRLAKARLGALRLGGNGTMEQRLDVEGCLAVEIPKWGGS
jgi:hypothetical protein